MNLGEWQSFQVVEGKTLSAGALTWKSVLWNISNISVHLAGLLSTEQNVPSTGCVRSIVVAVTDCYLMRMSISGHRSYY